MPGFNQNGPMGNGPMTGRKMGKCTNFGAGRKSSAREMELENSDMTGMRFAQGRGLGRRCRCGQNLGMRYRNRNCN